MENCLFCKLVAKKIPSHIVHEDDITVGFLDIFPSAPGHTMIIHKKHGLSVHDYTEEELGAVMSRVQKMAKKLGKIMECDWISIGINHLEPTGVPHLHIHLIPRWNTDGGGALQSIVKNPPKEELASLAEKIRNG